MKLTKAENLFFDLLEAGDPVSMATAELANCGKSFTTVIRNMGYTDGKQINPKWAYPIPISKNVRENIKKAVYQYNEEHSLKDAPTKKGKPAIKTDEELKAELRALKEELKKRGYKCLFRLTREEEI